MKYLKLFEEFIEFQMDEISKQEYYSILYNRLVYIPESKVLEFKRNLSKEYKLGYGRASVKDTVEFFRIEYETEIDYHITSKRFSIKKKSLGADEPCYIMSYHYEEFTSFAAPQSHIETLPNQERIFFEKKSYYTFEESDFNQMCENPQILLDYLDKNNMIKESLFGDIPDPEIMTLDEYDDEINNGKEEEFNQKETELFIALSDTILVKHKIDALEIGYSQLSFSMVNGDDGIYPELESTDVLRSITSYKNEDEFYYVNVWEREWRTEDHNGTKSYRCDGYKCWEKFLREIFQDYRDLINTKDNKVIKESFGGPIPDPEPMDVNEWDEEVTDAEEVPFDQKEKELFIALSDTINVKNKINTPQIGKSDLYFQLVNGDSNPKLKETTPIRNISIYKNDDEYYYVSVWGMSFGEKLYRCDGYECWEKFLTEIFQEYKEFINDKILEPEKFLYGAKWDAEFKEMVKFDQVDINLFESLCDTIPNEWKKIYNPVNLNQQNFEFHFGKDGVHGLVHVGKTDDDYYLLEIWKYTNDTEYYKCDGFECMEKLLRKTFDWFKEFASSRSKTNESLFDEVPEPTSFLDENGDYIPGSSRASMNNREPFNKKEKSFINQLLETLNEEYISTNFSDNTEFVLNMGEMGETTHGMRIVKLTDDYYEVQYNNFVDSDDEYIYCECDGFECLSKLMIRLFEKINKDYDYEGD